MDNRMYIKNIWIFFIKIINLLTKQKQWIDIYS